MSINSIVLPPSQNPLEAPIAERVFKLTEDRLDERRYSLFNEYGLANYTGMEIAIVQADGKVIFIPSLTASPINGFVRIDYVTSNVDKEVLDKKRLVIPGTGLLRKFYTRTSIKIPIEVLMKAPQFVPECGFVIAIGDHINDAQRYQVNSEEFNSTALDLAAQNYFKQFSTPLLMLANQHEKQYERLYVALGRTISIVPVVSVPSLPEGVIIVFNDKKRTKIKLGFDWDNPTAYSETRDEMTWVVGTDYNAVMKRVNKNIEKKSMLVNPETLEERVILETKKISDKYTKKTKKQKDEIESLKNTIKILKQDKLNLKSELEKSESITALSSKERLMMQESMLQRQKSSLSMQESQMKTQEMILRQKEMTWKTTASIIGSVAAIVGTIYTIAKLKK